MPATYEPIATTTLGANASTFSFSTIPGTYTDLRMVVVLQGSADSYPITFRFNSDSGSNYSMTQMRGTGAAAQSARDTNQTALFTQSYIGVASGVWNLATLDIFNYAGSTNKTALFTMSSDKNGSGIVDVSVGLWRNTSAITNIEVKANQLGSQTFQTGTTATLYGILKA